MIPPPSWITPESWEAFGEMRKKIKRPLTEYAEKRIIEKLVLFKSLGYDPQFCLDESIEHSWQTIYARKPQMIPHADGGESAAKKEAEQREAELAARTPEQKAAAKAILDRARAALRVVSK